MNEVKLKFHTELEEKAWEALDTVKDPEIPVISVVDLGIITNVKIDAEGNVVVDMTPTFAGCPAVHYMVKEMKVALTAAGFTEPVVNIHYNTPWSSNMISEKGKKALKEFGLSPPPVFEGTLSMKTLQKAVCPKCGSEKTRLLNPFGPTACRAIHHCESCLETFEQFKPL